MLVYAMESYLHFIQGEDDSEEMIDGEFMEKLQHERELMEEGVSAVGDSIRVLEEQLEGLRNEPSVVQVAEQRNAMLEEDVEKFNALIDFLNGRRGMLEKAVEEKETELAAKVGENAKICEENEELGKKVEAQGINARDVERMKRELEAVERDIGDAEVARSTWEEKSREIDATILSRIDDLEAQLNLPQRETEEYISRCVAEAQNMADAMEADVHKLEIVEREAAELLKNTKLKLQEVIKQEEDETQMCTRELWELIDRVANFKEYMALKIYDMRRVDMEFLTNPTV